MRISIFVKTFLILLVSFSAVFFFSSSYNLNRFPEVYINENITAIRETILEESDNIASGTPLADTDFIQLSSGTSFVLIDNFAIVEQLGPTNINDSDLVPFIIGVYEHEESIVEGKLTYYTHQVEDMYYVDYIYEFELGDYIIISAAFQALSNVDMVLNNLNIVNSIIQFIVIVILSVVISLNISRPLKKINRYAADISNLNFDTKLHVKRNDEFRDLVGALNEMTFNLKKAYSDLEQANEQLSNTIDYEQQQEQKKQQFLMAINHELKTPLSVMKGMVEGMLDNVGRYQDKETYLKEVLNLIQSIEQITSEFTNRLRLEDKMNDGETVESSLIETIVAQLEPLSKERDIKVKVSLDDAILPLSEELLTMLITNVVKNAIRYAISSPVDIHGVVNNGNYIIHVRNKGRIQDNDLVHIFESYYRADHTNQDGSGTGIGLFVVKEICSLYNLEYKLYNDNRTVVFKVKIPIE